MLYLFCFFDQAFASVIAPLPRLFTFTTIAIMPPTKKLKRTGPACQPSEPIPVLTSTRLDRDNVGIQLSASTLDQMPLQWIVSHRQHTDLKPGADISLLDIGGGYTQRVQLKGKLGWHVIPMLQIRGFATFVNNIKLSPSDLSDNPGLHKLSAEAVASLISSTLSTRGRKPSHRSNSLWALNISDVRLLPEVLLVPFSGSFEPCENSLMYWSNKDMSTLREYHTPCDAVSLFNQVFPEDPVESTPDAPSPSRMDLSSCTLDATAQSSMTTDTGPSITPSSQPSSSASPRTTPAPATHPSSADTHQLAELEPMPRTDLYTNLADTFNSMNVSDVSQVAAPCDLVPVPSSPPPTVLTEDCGPLLQLTDVCQVADAEGVMPSPTERGPAARYARDDHHDASDDTPADHTAMPDSTAARCDAVCARGDEHDPCDAAPLDHLSMPGSITPLSAERDDSDADASSDGASTWVMGLGRRHQSPNVVRPCVADSPCVHTLCSPCGAISVDYGGSDVDDATHSPMSRSSHVPFALTPSDLRVATPTPARRANRWQTLSSM